MPKGKVFVFVPIIVLLVAGVVVFFPLSPAISGVFSVSTDWSGRVDVRLATASYVRVPLMQSYWVGSGNLTMQLRPVQDGPYRIEIEVRYGSTLLLNQTYSRASDGLYGFRALFLFERASSYIIRIRVSAPGSIMQPVEISFRIIPS
jgi:hypothetical protein